MKGATMQAELDSDIITHPYIDWIMEDHMTQNQ